MDAKPLKRAASDGDDDKRLAKLTVRSPPPSAVATPPMQRSAHQLISRPIIIEVGPEETRQIFCIPKDLMCKCSKTFKGILDDPSFDVDAHTTLTFRDMELDIFRAMQYYMYHEELAFRRLEEESNIAGAEKELTYCVRIWRAGKMYKMAGMQNCAMIRICRLLKWWASFGIALPHDTLKMCFQEIHPDSPLHRLAMEYIVYRVEVRGTSRIDDFADVFSVLPFNDTGLAALYWKAKNDYKQRQCRGDMYPSFYSLAQHKRQFFLETEIGAGRELLEDRESSREGRSCCKRSCEKCGLFAGVEFCSHCKTRNCSCGLEVRTVMWCQFCARKNPEDESYDKGG